jgi:8-oxoguanine deaminase
MFCAPERARHAMAHGRPVVRDGEVVTVEMPAAVREHNRHAAALLAG